MKKNKLIQGLIHRLIFLLEESEDIFFEERPWLNYDVAPKIFFSPRRKQNELEIQKTLTKLEELLNTRQNHTIDIRQKSML